MSQAASLRHEDVVAGGHTLLRSEAVGSLWSSL